MRTFSFARFAPPWHVLMIAIAFLAIFIMQLAACCAAEEPMDLFSLPVEDAASIRSDAGSVGHVAPLDLFACEPEAVSTSTGEFLDLFGCGDEPPTLSRSELVEPVGRDLRPLVLQWSPTWCGVCAVNANVVGTGDSRCRVKTIKGDETKFPAEVQAYANGVFPPGTSLAGQQRGWPVWQFQRSDGGWGFAHHTRSLNDLAALHRLKPGDPIPESTFPSKSSESSPKPVAMLSPPSPVRGPGSGSKRR